MGVSCSLLTLMREATQSTVEMRADLLREMCRFLKLDNVKLENRHA